MKDLASAQRLGSLLFWDTLQVVTARQTEENLKPGAMAPVVEILLARHPLDRYRPLIERAFTDSVWNGPGDAQVRANFALIWRISTRLYESTLQGEASKRSDGPGPTPAESAQPTDPVRPEGGPANLHVCRPNPASDEFKCTEDIDPVRIVPIPSQGPALVSLNSANIG